MCSNAKSEELLFKPGACYRCFGGGYVPQLDEKDTHQFKEEVSKLHKGVVGLYST